MVVPLVALLWCCIGPSFGEGDFFKVIHQVDMSAFGATPANVRVYGNFEAVGAGVRPAGGGADDATPLPDWDTPLTSSSGAMSPAEDNDSLWRLPVWYPLAAVGQKVWFKYAHRFGRESPPDYGACDDDEDEDEDGFDREDDDGTDPADAFDASCFDGANRVLTLPSPNTSLFGDRAIMLDPVYYGSCQSNPRLRPTYYRTKTAQLCPSLRAALRDRGAKQRHFFEFLTLPMQEAAFGYAVAMRAEDQCDRRFCRYMRRIVDEALAVRDESEMDEMRLEARQALVDGVFEPFRRFAKVESVFEPAHMECKEIELMPPNYELLTSSCATLLDMPQPKSIVPSQDGIVSCVGGHCALTLIQNGALRNIALTDRKMPLHTVVGVHKESGAVFLFDRYGVLWQMGYPRRDLSRSDQDLHALCASGALAVALHGEAGSTLELATTYGPVQLTDRKISVTLRDASTTLTLVNFAWMMRT